MLIRTTPSHRTSRSTRLRTTTRSPSRPPQAGTGGQPRPLAVTASMRRSRNETSLEPASPARLEDDGFRRGVFMGSTSAGPSCLRRWFQRARSATDGALSMCALLGRCAARSAMPDRPSPHPNALQRRAGWECRLGPGPGRRDPGTVRERQHSGRGLQPWQGYPSALTSGLRHIEGSQDLPQSHCPHMSFLGSWLILTPLHLGSAGRGDAGTGVRGTLTPSSRDEDAVPRLW